MFAGITLDRLFTPVTVDTKVFLRMGDRLLYRSEKNESEAVAVVDVLESPSIDATLVMVRIERVLQDEKNNRLTVDDVMGVRINGLFVFK